MYFVIDDKNCKFEGMTKEEIYDAIAEATGNTPTPIDEAFITKVKEQNTQQGLKLWKGTSAQYNALEHKDSNTIYFIDSNTVLDFKQSIDRLDSAIGAIHEEFDHKISYREFSDRFSAYTNFTANSQLIRVYEFLDFAMIKIALSPNSTLNSNTWYIAGDINIAAPKAGVIALAASFGSGSVNDQATIRAYVNQQGTVYVNSAQTISPGTNKFIQISGTYAI